MSEPSAVKVDATWIGFDRPFHRLSRPPENPHLFARGAEQRERLAAHFYPDGQLQFLFSGYPNEYLYLERARPLGTFCMPSLSESYRNTGYHTELDHFDSQPGRPPTPMAFEDWVRKSIDWLWESANRPVKFQ